MNIIRKAMEEDTKEYAFRIYVAVLPNMDKKNFKTFNEYWESIRPKQDVMDTRSTDEIMDEIKEINQLFEKGGKNIGTV